MSRPSTTYTRILDTLERCASYSLDDELDRTRVATALTSLFADMVIEEHTAVAREVRLAYQTGIAEGIEQARDIVRKL